jgi:hypothetical protein
LQNVAKLFLHICTPECSREVSYGLNSVQHFEARFIHFGSPDILVVYSGFSIP